jgi:hypothetical protein
MQPNPNHCPGREIDGKPLQVCAGCVRPAAKPHPWRRLSLIPAARRCGGGKWVCTERIEAA